MRCSSDLNSLGMTLYSRPTLRFELRNSTMDILQRVIIGDTGCCGLTALPRLNWLISDGHFLYIIDQNSLLTKVEHQSKNGIYYGAGNVASFAEQTVVLRSYNVLYFYPSS